MPSARALLALLLCGALGACAGAPQERDRAAPPATAEGASPEAAESGAAAADAPMTEGPSSGLQPGLEAGREEVAEAPLPVPQAETAEVYGGPRAVPDDAADSADLLPAPRTPVEPAKPKDGAGKPARGGKAPETPKTAAAVAPASPAAGAVEEKMSGAPARREVLAQRGDTVVIDLEGRGWLLLPGQRQGVSFTGSETGPQRTTFTFKALEYGDYELAFQLQDNSRGSFRGEVVRLRVLPEEQFRRLLSSPAGSQPKSEPGKAGLAAAGPAPADQALAGGEAVDPARLQKAESLFAGGFYDLALPEYLSVYREGDPLLNDRLAGIYLGQGEGEAAAKFYGRNLSAAPPYGQRAVLGLVRAGLASGSPETVLEHLTAFLALPAAETEKELLGVARFAARQGRHPLALDLLTEYLRRHPRGSGLDAAYFQLAQLYELESPLRDVRRAREYYRKVYDEFPESEYAEQARSRILYLDRHFFHVQ